MTKNTTRRSHIEQVEIKGEAFFKIDNIGSLRPFFMSVVSDSDHWMFISSNGGLTAGRRNAEYALFPYYTDDKITEMADITGSKSVFQVTENDKLYIWEPFSNRYEGRYQITRNLYKNTFGNKILFEEINHGLNLTFRYQWNSSNTYGFIKKSQLINNGTSKVAVSVLDGIQNILPYGVGSYLQNNTSNLVDAYKRSELEPASGLGIFALSAIIVDKAEPSEALKANIAWSMGLEKPKHLLSSLQLQKFRQGFPVEPESDIKAEKGAYFINAKVTLMAGEEKEWMLIADVNKNHSQIAELIYSIQHQKNLYGLVIEKIELGTQRLIELVASADGLQCTEDPIRDSRHFANTMFNIMRGGVFDNNYTIEKWDFQKYLQNANAKIASTFKERIDALPEVVGLDLLRKVAGESRDKDFERLCLEYLPLKFSRRHGDPSRPWNRFSINTKSEIDGSKILDYEGNWRDIFQNWEALAHAFPEFMESMICKFLNASTFDGYNPYRVTKGGFDWETIEPDDPWSYIGYWGDHQIIYLLKFLEFLEDYQPGTLETYFNRDIFVYANVPYKIKRYDEILKNPKDTIDFDHTLDKEIRAHREELGADAALLCNREDERIHVNLIEKILATVLAKFSNFIPGGGIWMNTQRPEWNDANNALVGNGVSMVTLYYLRRFLVFFKTLFADTVTENIKVSEELAGFFKQIKETLEINMDKLSGNINDSDRRIIMNSLGSAASAFRWQVYEQGFQGRKSDISTAELKGFVNMGLAFLDHSIALNKRSDNLYHAYNLMTVEDSGDISIAHLPEMLEGQVAVLSSAYLSSGEALTLLDALKASKLFRPDQYSYILYPNKELKGFLKRNSIPANSVSKSQLLKELVGDGNQAVIEKDRNGDYHFNGNLKNAGDLKAALQELPEKYKDRLLSEERIVLQIFEEVFNHKAFTGRSGTFYGYEGLGSIYWHMVSKLQLAVQECCLKAIWGGEPADITGRLLEHYYEINEGIGVHKPPAIYGAFPTDPYSHTPAGKGAQQPGMTGQVKEDILSRFGEFGTFVKKGELHFDPCLLRKAEFLKEGKVFHFVTVDKEIQEYELPEDCLGFTCCQIPVIYHISDKELVEVHWRDGRKIEIDGLRLDLQTSKAIFDRSGIIDRIDVNIKAEHLK